MIRQFQTYVLRIKVNKMKSLRITVRVEKEHRKAIEDLIRKRKFENLSQVIRAALNEFLSKR